jgi:hypothetical protein
VRALLASIAACSVLASCTVYQTAPGVYQPYPPQTSFERSWSAMAGAFADSGVQVLTEDRAAGVLRGRRGGIDLTGRVRTQADGSVRVEFNTAGATNQDPQLIERVSRAYDYRMGR